MSSGPVQELMHQALLAEKRGGFDEARDLLRRLVAADESPLSLDARLRLGKLLLQGGSNGYDEASGVLAAARAQAERLGAPRAAAAAIHLTALLEHYQRRPARAQALLDESPVAAQAALPSAARAQWLHYNGLLEVDRHDLNSAERFYFRAHQVYQEANDKPGLAEVCDSLANLLRRRGKAGYALTFARQSLALKEQFGDLFGQAVSHGTAGRALLLQARYDEAAAEFERDLEIARMIGDDKGEGIMLNSLGEVALLRNEPAAAEAFYTQALTVDARPIHLAHAHFGLARVFMGTGRDVEASAECERAREILDAHPDLVALRHFLDGLEGALAWRGGDRDAGKGRLEAAVAALEAAGQKLDTIPLLYELRDRYQADESRALAVGVMAKALHLLGECGSDRGIKDAEDWLRTVDTPNLVRLALEQYVPGWVVSEILEGRLRRAPTRKQELAVLFSDVRGFTTMTQGLGAEQIVELLNEWFAEATQAIRRHGGVVDKFIGDAVMALFGVPEPRPGAAADAVRAALEMRDALEAMNMRQKALGRPEVHVGIGVDCGEAVVGFMGSHLRQSYTAIGDVVNTAARLEGATKEQECDILITAAVNAAQQADGVAETQFVGKLPLKGRAEPEPTYKVLGPRAAQAR